MPELLKYLRSRCGRRWATISIVMLLSGCGIGMDNEVRLQRGEEAFARQDYRAAMIDAKSVLQQEPDNVDARLLLGRVSIFLGDPKAAEKELGRAIELGTTDPTAVIELGQALLMQGKYQQVLDEYDPRQWPDVRNRMAVLELTGKACLGLGDTAAARDAFGQIPESSERYLDSLLGIAASYVAEGRYDQARTYIESVLSREMEHFSALLALASLSMTAGNTVEAERIYQRIVNLARAASDSPTETVALTGLSEARLANRDIEGARQSVAMLAALTPNSLPQQYLSARIAYEEQNWQAAQDILQELVRSAPGYVSAKILLGAVHYQRGNLAQAETYLSEAVSAQPEHLDARKMLAETQLKMRKAEDAVEVLRPVAGNGEIDADAMILAARASITAGDFDGATEFLRKSIESDPDDIDLQLNLASAYLAAGDIDRTMETLRIVSDSGGETTFRLEALKILTLLRAGETAEAMSAADALIGRWPDDPNAHNLVGAIFLSAGDMEKARRSFARVTEIVPGSPSVWVNLGRLEAADGNSSIAAGHFEKALAVDAGHSPAMIELARFSILRQDNESARDWLEQAIAADPASMTAHTLLGRYYLSIGQLSEARQITEAGFAIDPSDADILNVLGLVLLAQGENQDGLGKLRQAASASPKNAMFGFHYGSALLRTGEAGKAMSEFRRVADVNPGYFPAVEALVAMEARAGNYEAAERLIAELQALQPGNAAPIALEADYRWSRQQFEQAARGYDLALSTEPDAAIAARAFRMRSEAGFSNPEEPLERYLEHDPANTDVMLLLAQYHQLRGEEAMAQARYEAILAAKPDHVVAANNLAWLYFENGDPKATVLARNAHAHSGGDPDVTDTLGWILLKSGSVEEGVELLRTANRVDPDDPDIRYHLAAGLVEVDETAAAEVLLRELMASGQDFAGRAEAMKLLETL